MPQSATTRSTQIQPGMKASPAEASSNRDVVEQVIIALILALLIRGFAAEAFVIPTGSMAPTLMGRHKDVFCPQCGANFQVNASEEVEDRGGGTGRITNGTCTNCRYRAQIDQEPSYRGDRILVTKFLYDLPFLPGGGGPDRWDVVVFKYPEGPEVNYIKRLVGLPDEELQVNGGDVRVRSLEQSSAPHRYPRRLLSHQSAMQMLVWDDAYQPEAFQDRPEWRRWQPDDVETWSTVPPDRRGRSPSYTSVPSASDWARLSYHHLVPDPLQWEAARSGSPMPQQPRATLITDLYSYNSGQMAHRESFEWFQPHWVGDLTLSARVRAAEPKGQLRLELIKGGVSNRCEIDLSTGQAQLFHGANPLGESTITRLKDTAAHDVAFANVDGRLTLWVDGRTPFGDGREYDDGSAPPAVPTAADLGPVGIATRGLQVTVSDLVLKRDIYYTLQPGPSDYLSSDFRRSDDRAIQSSEDQVAWMFDVLADASRFSEFGKFHPRSFPIHPGHYMMLGDNSPRSKDSRGWSQGDQTGYYDPALGLQVEGWAPEPRESWEVPEKLLIGKAFFVYWPHAWPLWPDIAINPDFHVPFWPNFSRMKAIR